MTVLRNARVKALKLDDNGMGWVEVGHMDLTTRTSGDDHPEEFWDKNFIVAAERTVRLSLQMAQTDPYVLALMAGRWVSVGDQYAKAELRWRINQHWHGNDPGKPVNWKGIEE